MENPFKAMTRAIVLFLVVAGAASGQSLGEVAARSAAQSPNADVQKLLEVSGALKLGRQMASLTAEQVMKAMAAAGPEMPARARQIVTELIDAEFERAFVADGPMGKGLARIYARHFTTEEIRGLIAFYESPLGRKVTDTLPAVSQESMQVAMEWAGASIPDLQQRIEARLRAEGLIK